MSANRSTALVALLCIFVLTAACGGQGREEPAVAQAPLMGAIVPYGSPELRELTPTIEIVPNCNGVSSPVIKNPSLTVGSSHSVEWEVGGNVGTGVTVGGGVVPGGVSLQGALEGHVANDLTNSIQQSNAWELPADPGTIMEYTIAWREIWQPAYVDVTFLEPEPSIIRINLKYRTGVRSDILEQNQRSCPTETPSTEAGLVTPLPITEATTSIEPTQTAVVPLVQTLLDVPVDSELGEFWLAPETGMYLIGVESGAYNPWQYDSDCASAVTDRPGCWRTRMNAYVGCEIAWELSPGSTEMAEPAHASFSLGDFTYMESLEAAEAIAKGQSLYTITLNQGDCIRFVVIDGLSLVTGFSAYAGNRGGVMTLRILGPQ